MKIEVKIPSVGESVREALLAEWYKRNGDHVGKDDVLFVIETDKVTLEIAAEADGVLEILVPAGQNVAVGAVVGTIETEAGAVEEEPKPARGPEKVPGAREPEPAAAEPRVAPPREEPPSPVIPFPTPPAQPSAAGQPPDTARPQAARPQTAQPQGTWSRSSVSAAPSALRLASEKGVDLLRIKGTGPGGQITRGDVLLFLEKDMQPGGGEYPEPGRFETPYVPAPGVAPIPGVMPLMAEPPSARPSAPSREEIRREETAAGEVTTRKPMSRIRQRIAERLLEAKQGTAMLTTFNEADMSRIQALRAGYKDAFRQRHGASLGFMSFFIKASVAALQEFPEVNAFIDGKDVVYHEYYHIGIAIGAERGLVVPVIRHADRLGFAGLEKAIVDFVNRIKENRLDVADLESGTFTITNGGVYGSLMSTPILNPPQSAILGMHKIEDRAVVVGGQIVVRPMMYLALSYDHRLIDGKDAVSFLKRIKEYVENPERLMLEI